MDSTYDKLYKLIMVSENAVGKSNLLRRFTGDSFDPVHNETIGIEFGCKIVEEDGKKIKLVIWDTASQKSFRSIVRSYYRKSAGIILTYDITNQDSFDQLENRLEDVRLESPEASIVVCGNKSDLETERVITAEQGMKFAENYGASFIETSAKNNILVDELFILLTRLIIQKEKV
uniref:Rab GTPase 2-like protein n=1 Tax=Euplotoides octocarinatus TaxID=2716877 RepID=E2GMZ2_EUPOC|nr:Rab GTPase 2-like protein [Euplotes octocarinatus]